MRPEGQGVYHKVLLPRRDLQQAREPLQQPQARSADGPPADDRQPARRGGCTVQPMHGACSALAKGRPTAATVCDVCGVHHTGLAG